MAKRRVVVTGMGIISPVGVGSAAAWENILACRSGIAGITRFDAAAFSSRIAGAATHGAVEVEDQARHLRTNEILAVERVEDVDGRLGDDAAHVKLLGEPEIERRERGA